MKPSSDLKIWPDNIMIYLRFYFSRRSSEFDWEIKKNIDIMNIYLVRGFLKSITSFQWQMYLKVAQCKWNLPIPKANSFYLFSVNWTDSIVESLYHSDCFGHIIKPSAHLILVASALSCGLLTVKSVFIPSLWNELVVGLSSKDYTNIRRWR